MGNRLYSQKYAGTIRYPNAKKKKKKRMLTVIYHHIQKLTCNGS